MADSRSTTYAQQLSRLIQQNTTSTQAQSDLTPFRAFHALLHQEFPHLFSVVEEEEFDGSLLLRWPGTHPHLAPILLMSHHDVVPAPGPWTHPPFSGAVAEGKVWGRGTLDTKGSLWAILRGADELAETGFVPRRDTYFVSTCNEETSGAGAQAIARALELRKLHFHFTLDEGGMVVEAPLPGMTGYAAMVGVGEKGCADLQFIAHSHGGHASMPPNDTPLVRLGQFMAHAQQANLFPAALTPTTLEMLRRMAPSMSGVTRSILAHAHIFAPLLRRLLPRLSPAAAALTRTTLAFTQCQGSEASNVLPDQAWVVGNMRYSHHQGWEHSLQAVSQLAQQYHISVQVLNPGTPSAVSDFRGEGFQQVEQAMSQVFPGIPVIPYIMNAASDSRFFSPLSDQCLRFAPFRITQQQLDSIHGLDECVDVDALAPAVDFYKYILQEA